MNSFFTILQKNIRSKDIIQFSEKPLPKITVQLGGKLFPVSNRYQYWSKVFNSSLPDEDEDEDLHMRKPMAMFVYIYMDECFAKLHKTRGTRIQLPDKAFAIVSGIKISVLKRMLNNNFWCKEHADMYLDIFSKTQRAYHGFLRLARIWRIKRSVAKITHDLYMNPIDEHKRTTMVLYQDGAKYLFRLSDIMNILHTALSNAVRFFVEPIEPKNPYTNKPFTHAMLYAIYFKIRESSYRMPHLFQLFYNVGFDVKRYTYENEAIIRDTYIRDYVYKSPPAYLRRSIDIMLRNLDKRRVLRIHKDFPVDRLVDVMRPYLYLYYMNLYSISQTDKKYNSYYLLQKKMRQFIRFNPHFGRIFYVIRKNSRGEPVRTTEFNDRCADFLHDDIELEEDEPQRNEIVQEEERENQEDDDEDDDDEDDDDDDHDDDDNSRRMSEDEDEEDDDDDQDQDDDNAVVIV